jgi:hypothetical protein
MRQWTPLTFASKWSVILNPGDTSDDLQAANTFHYTNPICVTEKITLPDHKVIEYYHAISAISS